MLYRNFHIEYSPGPTPLRAWDFEYWHKDYDGPDDGRCGRAASEEDAKVQIDNYHAELADDEYAAEMA